MLTPEERKRCRVYLRSSGVTIMPRDTVYVRYLLEDANERQERVYPLLSSRQSKTASMAGSARLSGGWQGSSLHLQ